MTIKIILEDPAEPMVAANTEAEASSAAALRAGGAAFAGMFDWFGFGIRNADAMMKSRAILVRGVRALNNTSLGVALMSVEQTAAAVHGLSECRTVPDWVDVQKCIFKLGVGRMVGTSCMLSNMAVQVAEDASVPLTRRMGAALDEFTTASVA